MTTTNPESSLLRTLNRQEPVGPKTKSRSVHLLEPLRLILSQSEYYGRSLDSYLYSS